MFLYHLNASYLVSALTANKEGSSIEFRDLLLLTLKHRLLNKRGVQVAFQTITRKSGERFGKGVNLLRALLGD